MIPAAREIVFLHSANSVTRWHRAVNSSMQMSHFPLKEKEQHLDWNHNSDKGLNTAVQPPFTSVRPQSECKAIHLLQVLRFEVRWHFIFAKWVYKLFIFRPFDTFLVAFLFSSPAKSRLAFILNYCLDLSPNCKIFCAVWSVRWQLGR